MTGSRLADIHIYLVSGSDADPDSGDLAEFLMLLRGAYVAGLRLERRSGTVESLDLKALLSDLSTADIDTLFGDAPAKDALRTRRVSHESPLDFWLYGVASAICGAVLLIGGKLKVGVTGVSVELPYGLIEAISRFKDLFGKRTRTRVGYGAKDRSVKLTKGEYKELMRHDPASRTRGGFQRFLIGLQFRVDHRTRELTLSGADIDVILKHGAQPQKGGWQSSIRKIFGSHFDWK